MIDDVLDLKAFEHPSGVELMFFFARAASSSASIWTSVSLDLVQQTANDSKKRC